MPPSRHRTDVRDYGIAHTPIANATYLTFVEGGGYERREWWSDEGWAWKEQYDIWRREPSAQGRDPSDDPGRDMRDFRRPPDRTRTAT